MFGGTGKKNTRRTSGKGIPRKVLSYLKTVDVYPAQVAERWSRSRAVSSKGGHALWEWSVLINQ